MSLDRRGGISTKLPSNCHLPSICTLRTVFRNALKGNVLTAPCEKLGPIKCDNYFVCMFRKRIKEA